MLAVGEIKQCSRCKQKKPISEFCANRSRRDGLHEVCKRCRSQDPKRVAANARSARKQNTNPDQRFRKRVRGMFFRLDKTIERQTHNLGLTDA